LRAKMIGIDGTTVAMMICSHTSIPIAARVTCLLRFPAFTIWTITAIGSKRLNMDGSGRRRTWLEGGRPTAPAIGGGGRRADGRGFHTNRGDGFHTITDDGHTIAVAGAGLHM